MSDYGLIFLSLFLRSLVSVIAVMMLSTSAFAGTPASQISFLLQNLALNARRFVVEKGQATLFYRDGEEIVIRECAKQSMVKKPPNCRLKEGTSERRFTITEFKRKLKEKLMDSSITYRSDVQEAVRRYRVGVEKGFDLLVEDERYVRERMIQIGKAIKEYGLENTEELEKLKNGLATIESRLKSDCQLADSVRAINNQIEKIVNKTIGNSKLWTLLYSKGKGGLESNILKFFATLPCGEVKQDASEGTTCVTNEGFLFLRTRDPISNEMGWRDTLAGITWFDPMAKNISWDEAQQLCAKKGQVVPSGWPTWRNGREAAEARRDGTCGSEQEFRDEKCFFPNHDSVLVLAEKHGFREVLKDMDTKVRSEDRDTTPLFLSSSQVPDSGGDLVYQHRQGGVALSTRARSEVVAVRCVSAPESMLSKSMVSKTMLKKPDDGRLAHKRRKMPSKNGKTVFNGAPRFSSRDSRLMNNRANEEEKKSLFYMAL